jgi:hypothetical protein
MRIRKNHPYGVILAQTGLATEVVSVTLIVFPVLASIRHVPRLTPESQGIGRIGTGVETKRSKALILLDHFRGFIKGRYLCQYTTKSLGFRRY